MVFNDGKIHTNLYHQIDTNSYILGNFEVYLILIWLDLLGACTNHVDNGGRRVVTQMYTILKITAIKKKCQKEGRGINEYPKFCLRGLNMPPYNIAI